MGFPCARPRASLVELRVSEELLTLGMLPRLIVLNLTLRPDKIHLTSHRSSEVDILELSDMK